MTQLSQPYRPPIPDQLDQFNHQSIIDFKGKSDFIYDNGNIPIQGGSFRRSLCIDKLFSNPGGSMQRIQKTSEGVDPVK